MLVHEGGYVDHPKDPGGATNLGITIGTLRGWLGRQATKAEVKALTTTTVAPIYRAKYWDKIGGDDLPSRLDAAMRQCRALAGADRLAAGTRDQCESRSAWPGIDSKGPLTLVWLVTSGQQHPPTCPI